jgi:hypothetical protein
MAVTIDGTSGITATSVIANSSSGIGYTTGSGGVVTQATSKSTAITLTSLSGTSNSNAAALASNTTAGFVFNNSFITSTDNVVVNNVGGNGGSPNYLVWVYIVQAGSCLIAIRNISGGSLSESVVINFAVIKGASS